MKKILFILLTLFCLVHTTKADTIDHWHVYHNRIKIGEFDLNSKKPEIVLKADSIKNNDSITVNYFKCTHCHVCPTYLTVENGKHHVITSSTGKGWGKPISFSLKDLKTNGLKHFEVFYFEGEIKSRSDKALIFRIKLE